MNLKEIMAITGKPGLYKLVAQAKNGIIVESIVDQKRLQAFSHDKISTLEEISIYTESDDMPLKEVLISMYQKLDGKPAPELKGDTAKIKEFFGQMVPGYDKDRVYTSHMQKITSWYNLLIEHNLLDASLEEDEKENIETTDTDEPVKDETEKQESSENETETK